MKKLTTLLILFMMVLPFTGFSKLNDWDRLADFTGGERERAVSFSIGLKGYLATGQDSADNVHNDLWEFDPTANSWTQKASIPALGRRNAIGFAIGNRGYVGIGIDSPWGGRYPPGHQA